MSFEIFHWKLIINIVSNIHECNCRKGLKNRKQTSYICMANRKDSSKQYFIQSSRKSALFGENARLRIMLGVQPRSPKWWSRNSGLDPHSPPWTRSCLQWTRTFPTKATSGTRTRTRPKATSGSSRPALARWRPRVHKQSPGPAVVILHLCAMTVIHLEVADCTHMRWSIVV